MGDASEVIDLEFDSDAHLSISPHPPETPATGSPAPFRWRGSADFDPVIDVDDSDAESTGEAIVSCSSNSFAVSAVDHCGSRSLDASQSSKQRPPPAVDVSNDLPSASSPSILHGFVSRSPATASTQPNIAGLPSPCRSLSPPDPFAKALSRLGIEHLRPWQRSVLAHWHAGGDALVLSGTGSGKSLCFQVPALVAEGTVVIVISPLISLMRDQVALMAARNVSACFLGSGQTDVSIEERALAGEFSLVYVCPETVQRLLIELKALHQRGRIRLIAIDEAHCISRWGHDFRETYLRLGSLRRQFPGVPLMALTATATARVRDEIRDSLGLRSPYVCVNSFYRTNLAYSVRQSYCKKDCWESDLGGFFPGSAKRRPTGSGGAIEVCSNNVGDECSIIYCPSRRETEEIATWLKNRGIAAAPFHAKLPRDHLTNVQQGFLQGTITCVVATIAFGMGINKSNVRRVLHYGYPQSIEALHQESGRAGRDGRPATCILFANLTTAPRLLPNKRRSRETTEVFQKMLECLFKYAIARSGCRVHTLLRYFGEDKGNSWRCGSCDLCMDAAPQVGHVDLSCDYGQLLSAVQQTSHLRVAMGRGFETLTSVLQTLSGQVPPGLDESMGVEMMPCFGVGCHRPLKFWSGLASVLIDVGLVVSSRHASGQSAFARARRSGELKLPELSESGRVACASLERGECVPLIARLEPSSDVLKVLNAASRKEAQASRRVAAQASRKRPWAARRHGAGKAANKHGKNPASGSTGAADSKARQKWGKGAAAVGPGHRLGTRGRRFSRPGWLEAKGSGRRRGAKRGPSSSSTAFVREKVRRR
eukprot:TRINITY_DN24318_c0_g1_i1.p1 TRINITY_DN24318_c0_g1~~TRINITY_DN24318_c0_g1_i1.p1  ORF type:complete len:823 (-),score=106.28 TRINITY_DN24318_c0_g1_i1:19-2487(-)